MRYMLDTNICIYVIKHKPEKVLLKLQTIHPEDGVEKSAAVEKNRLALSMLLANMEILDFDVEAADCYGKIRADLEKKGRPIGPLDMMIAGHGQSLGYTVVTNNVKEFSRVTALRIENWAE